jgi:hypothetical protein
MVRWLFIPYRALKCFLIGRCNILVPEHEVTLILSAWLISEALRYAKSVPERL